MQKAIEVKAAKQADNYGAVEGGGKSPKWTATATLLYLMYTKKRGRQRELKHNWDECTKLVNAGGESRRVISESTCCGNEHNFRSCLRLDGPSF